MILAENCKTRYSVWYDIEGCTEPEAFAAEELSRALRELTGANFALITLPQPEPAIIVGSPTYIKDKFGIDLAAEDVGNEGFIIRTVGKDVVIAGGRPRGTLYGVYDFLERFCGCRWYTPTVKKMPFTLKLEVPDEIAIREVPALEYRESFFCGNALDGEWSAHNRCNGQMPIMHAHQGGQIKYFPFVHTFNALLSPDEYFDEHPEYFSMVDGKRVRERTQLCLTNPDVVEIATKKVRQWIEEHPEATIISVSQNDWYNPCTCPECSKIDEAEGSHAGSLIAFVNKIAENIEKDYPNIVIDTLAYQYARTPPRTIRPRPNVCVRLCSIECCFAHPLDECDLVMSFGNRIHGASFQKDLEGWSKVCDRLYIWDYVVNFHHYVMPFPNFGVLAPNIRYFIKNHVRGIFEEGSTSQWGKTEFIELKSWVIAKLLWNPYQDTMALVEDFIRGYYGAAAEKVLEYFNLLQSRLDASPESHFGIYDPPRTEYLRPQDIQKAFELFREAKALADNEDIRERVFEAELPIRYWALLKAEKTPEREKAIDEFHNDLVERNIMQITESVDLDESIDRLREGVIYRF